VTKPIDPQKLFSKLLQWVHPSPDLQNSSPVDETAKTEIAEPSLEAELPDIPGMNIKAGLARIGGSLPSLMRVLNKFCQTNADAPQKIKQALEAGNNDEARICAHTMAGVAGNLGVKAVEDSARALEAAIISNEKEQQQQILGSLSENLRAFLAGVARYSSQSSTQAQPAAGTSDHDAREAASELIIGLCTQLHQGDSEARETLEKISQLMCASEGSILQREFKEVATLIERYAFDEALEKIPQLENALHESSN
ncbi:MAG: Hpt domain-containing protein, partial [Candidatus Riflebacteria bacterium]|nr:Hpt domain-containing protein [Candidatus Riflebacteria bacterium]